MKRRLKVTHLWWLVSGQRVLQIIVVHNLEVLHRCVCDTPVEVEHVRLSVIIPHGGLIVQLDDVLLTLVLPFRQQALRIIVWLERDALVIEILSGNENRHLPGTLKPEDVSFIANSRQFLPGRCIL
ncbi:hypothetical protein FKM82_000252 [Ascaphus truei]